MPLLLISIPVFIDLPEDRSEQIDFVAIRGKRRVSLGCGSPMKRYLLLAEVEQKSPFSEVTGFDSLPWNRPLE